MNDLLPKLRRTFKVAILPLLFLLCSAVQAQSVNLLIKKLGSAKENERVEAQMELRIMGEQAREALRSAEGKLGDAPAHLFEVRALLRDFFSRNLFSDEVPQQQASYDALNSLAERWINDLSKEALRKPGLLELRKINETCRPVLEKAAALPGAVEGIAVLLRDLNMIRDLNAADIKVREKAIAEFRKMGESAREALQTAENEQRMETRQLMLVRKLIGEMLLSQSPLKPLDLKATTPFGEDTAKGIKGDPEVLVDVPNKLIVMNAEFALEQGPLEYLVVSKGPNARMHETIVAVMARPRSICWALLACNYTYAGELGEDGKINLPPNAGVMISIEYEWEEPHADLWIGERLNPPAYPAPKRKVRVPIEFFAWNSQTEQPMKRAPFAFTGSKFEKDPNTKRMIFKADEEKSVVAVKLDAYAILNTPLDMRDVDPQHGAGYGVNRHLTPQRGTKCLVVFEPWTGTDLKPEDLKDTGNKHTAGQAPAGQPPAGGGTLK